MRPYNIVTGKEYNGTNQVQLILTKENKGYKSSGWLTFLQAKDSGRKVKKGSKGVRIFCGFREFSKKDKDGKAETYSAPVGFATVFSLDQTEIMQPATKTTTRIAPELEKAFNK